MIAAAEVTDCPSDRGQAAPLMEQVQELSARGMEVYLPPDRMPHTRRMLAAPRGRIPADLSTADRMRRNLRTKQRRQRYGLRKELCEPMFGQIKQGRDFRQYLTRGKEKVGDEWRLICTGHNVLKLFGARNTGLVGEEFWSQMAAV